MNIRLHLFIICFLVTESDIDKDGGENEHEDELKPEQNEEEHYFNSDFNNK